jgi:glutamate racemase
MKKIGFLDSGIGGLTVLQAFCQNPSKAQNLEKVIYLADLINLPYGDKSLEELTLILYRNLEWFVGKVDLVVLACNTSSALLNRNILDKFKELQILDLIGALQEQIQDKYFHLNKIAVFSTLATHQAGAYSRALSDVLPHAQIVSIACPKLVPLIEAKIHKDISALNEAAQEALEEYVAKLPFMPEALVFGCTHYPLLRPVFEAKFPEILFLDPAEVLAQKLSDFGQMQYTQFEAFVSAEAELFATKLNSLRKVLPCVENFRNKVQIAKII